MPTKTVKIEVVQPLNYLYQRYEPGQTLEVDKTLADQAVAAGIAKYPDPAQPEPKEQ